MDFSFDEQQLEFRAQLRSMLERECTAVDVRAAFDAASVFVPTPPTLARAERESALSAEALSASRDRWERLASMGVVGLTVPESMGGLGLEMVDLVGLLEEAGFAGLPEPLAETVAMVVPLLIEAAQSEAVVEALISIAGGESIATAGVAGAGTDEAVVPWGETADLVVVASPERVVLAKAGELESTPVASIDATRRQARVSATADLGLAIAQGPQASVSFERLGRRAAVAASADLIGASSRLIAFAREHALQREQFGRPIGSFQAVKHLLATAFVRVEMARPVVYWAAASIDSDVDSPQCGRDCALAKAASSDAALDAARVALQIHGAMGYTWEHDLHMWLKRVWVHSASWGDSPMHLRSILEYLTN